MSEILLLSLFVNNSLHSFPVYDTCGIDFFERYRLSLGVDRGLYVHALVYLPSFFVGGVKSLVDNL